MTDFKGFRGAAKRLEDIDIPRIGARIGVGEDELHAFMDVEATGSGFDSLGRPKMLFEPHVFWRNLSGTKRVTAERLGLAYPTWRRNYPADSYPRLIKAMTIDETAALKSASWGLGQILGENYEMVGFATPQAMVFTFMDSEAAQLDAIVTFLIRSGIADDLKAHRWSTVARVYNGPSYRVHDYDGKMARAFARWQKIKDTPWTPEMDPGAGTVMPVLRKGAKGDLMPYVQKAQERLVAHGYLTTKDIDGIFGLRTEAAVKSFQETEALTVDGVIGPKTWLKLLLQPDIYLPLPLARKGDAFVPMPLPVSEKRVQTSDIATVVATDTSSVDSEGSYWPEIIACSLVAAFVGFVIYLLT